LSDAALCILTRDQHNPACSNPAVLLGMHIIMLVLSRYLLIGVASLVYVQGALNTQQSVGICRS
jgi:hypothetical protein